MKRPKVKWLLVALLMGVMVVGVAVPVSAAAAIQSWDLVDTPGKHMDWQDNTGSNAPYPQELFTYAQNLWNKKAGSVIRKDTALTAADAYIFDYYEISNNYGHTEKRVATLMYGTVNLNNFKMQPNGSANTRQKNAVAHEFGHALGLADNAPADLMRPNTNPDASALTSLTANDIASLGSAAAYW